MTGSHTPQGSVRQGWEIRVRAIGIILCFPAIWLAAPELERHGRHSDAAAWVQVYLIPTLCLGLILGAIHLWRPSRSVLMLAVLTLVVHVVIAGGFISG